jgi:hypothetical protein
MSSLRTNTFVLGQKRRRSLSDVSLVRPSQQKVLLGVLFVPIELTGQVRQMKSR